MNDVQFNAMLLASSDRALLRRRGEALADSSDFESNLAAVAPAPAAPPEDLAAAEPATTASPVPSTGGVTTLTGSQMDALMSNFGQPGTPSPPPEATPVPAAAAKTAKDSPAVAALKASPAAADLTPDQLKALLAGFGRDASTDVIEMAGTAPAEPAPAADSISATKFFPIARKANAAPSLYASIDTPNSEAMTPPAAARYFASPPNDNSYSSLYGATPSATDVAAEGSGAESKGTIVATAPDPSARYFPTSNGTSHPAAVTARDAYLRAMDINARMLGLSSQR